MTDRELLELAARAAGVELADPIDSHIPSGGLWITTGENSRDQVWSPLSNDGDALRLAVDLSLSLYTDGVASVSANTCYQHGNRLVTQAVSDSDKRAAARRAIVRAAAEIGKRMEASDA